MRALEVLPKGVQKVYFKSDTAAYQKELMIYCAEGQNERFRVIEFAVGVDVTAEFKKAVAAVEEKEWHPLEREIEGWKLATGQRNGRRFVLYLPGPLGAKRGLAIVSWLFGSY